MNLDEATLDWLTDLIVGALAREERVGAAATLLLLRRFSAATRADLEEPLGAALARALDERARAGQDDDRETWIAVFSEAAAISDDPRLPRAAADLLAAARRAWRDGGVGVDAAMRAVDACLGAANIPEARALAADAVDGLERIVAGAYRPGQGMAHDIGGTTFVRGGVGDNVRAASALLTAYMLTGRLPYAMLADELMQCAQRAPRDGRDVPFALACDAARVCCGLAALHRDEEYRRAAVLAADGDYARDAARTLASLAPSVREKGLDAAPFGLALADWLRGQ